VLSDHAHEWFEIDFESPFMLLISRVLQPERIPSVSHVDGTARVQTVSKGDNPFLHGVLSAFFTATGVPVLLNTSFNGNGEPLVESPADAQRFFSEGTIGALVINDRLVVR
jgi:carbamoyltransferase